MSGQQSVCARSSRIYTGRGRVSRCAAGTELRRGSSWALSSSISGNRCVYGVLPVMDWYESGNKEPWVCQLLVKGSEFSLIEPETQETFF